MVRADIRRRGRTLGVVLALALLSAACISQATPFVPATLDVTTVSHTPTPVPTPEPPGIAAAQKFIALVTAKTASYHVSISGEFRLSVSDIKLVGSVDVSGADYASSVKYTFESGTPITVQTRVVKGAAYWKVGPTAWQKRSAFSTTSGVAPFEGVNAPNVQLVSSGSVGGQRRHTLQVNSGRILDITTLPSFNVSDEQINSETWTIVVDDAGRPISGTWGLRGRARVSGQLQNLVIELKATFSKVDAKITIKRPS